MELFLMLASLCHISFLFPTPAATCSHQRRSFNRVVIFGLIEHRGHVADLQVSHFVDKATNELQLLLCDVAHRQILAIRLRHESHSSFKTF